MALTSDARTSQIDTFLANAGWGEAARHALGQDASTRRYVRLVRADGASAMLMDAPGIEDAPCPPGADDATRIKLGWNAATRLAASRVDAFIALAGELERRGLSTPQILAADTGAGLALLEDFGEGREFARLIERGAAPETELYVAAARALAHLHSESPPPHAEGHGACWPILDFDALALRTNADLFAEWLPQFDERVVWDGDTQERWEAARDGLIARATALPRRFTLRDYHAENLLWLPARDGVRRVGLLDFQDAVLGWAGWDLAMLTQDARREVSPSARASALRAYCDASGRSLTEIEAELAIIGTLNALRITGLFARLIKRDAKPRYGAFLTRQQVILARNLTHSDMGEMARFVSRAAPFILDMHP